MRRASINIIFLFFFTLLGCDSNQISDKKNILPILGFRDVDITIIDGKKKVDTIYHTIPNFYFTAHTGEAITKKTVEGRIYVADFFFSHCPSICPVMTTNLKQFHQNTKDIKELIILSHTIDPKRDSLSRLNEYINTHEIDTRNNWFFLRGSQTYTYDIGKDGYLINANVDREAEGGFLHSEHFVLIDRTGRIRGMYEGTDMDHVNQLENDIRLLIKEEYGE